MGDADYWFCKKMFNEFMKNLSIIQDEKCIKTFSNKRLNAEKLTAAKKKDCNTDQVGPSQCS